MTGGARGLALAFAVATACTGREPSAGERSDGPPPAATAAPPAPEPVAAPPPLDPAALRALAEREEARDRYRSLAAAHAHAGRSTPQARARLEPALRETAASVAWQVACRGALCRVTARGDDRGWQALVAASEPVRRIADRVAVDPDGRELPVYVLLAEAGAAPGEDLLAEVARDLPAAVAARKCAGSAPAPAVVEVELRVDASGFTYRADDAPAAVLECLGDALSDVFRGVPVPPGAKSASRKVALRL